MTKVLIGREISLLLALGLGVLFYFDVLFPV